jgi:hypothetical protein
VLLFVKGAKFSLFGLPVAGGPGLFGVAASSIVLFLVTMATSDTGKNPEEFMALAHQPDTE